MLAGRGAHPGDWFYESKGGSTLDHWRRGRTSISGRPRENDDNE
jgi:hypothetical protein